LASEIVEQQGISAKKTLEQILINPDEAWDSDTLEKLEDAIFNYTGSDEHNALLERYGVKFAENSKMLFSMNDINAVFGDRAKEILSGTGIFNQTALENGIYELTSDGLKELLYHTAEVEKDSHGKNYLSYK